MPMDQLSPASSDMHRDRELSPSTKKQSALKKFVSVFKKDRAKMEIGSVPPPLCFQEGSDDSPSSSPKVTRRKIRGRKKERFSTAGDFTMWRPKVLD